MRSRERLRVAAKFLGKIADRMDYGVIRAAFSRTGVRVKLHDEMRPSEEVEPESQGYKTNEQEL